MAIFDCAKWMPVANRGGYMAAQYGLILHHAVMNGSLYSFFNSPSSGVSAHFWVAKDGRIEQYVDSDLMAWHGKQLNSRYCGVETEGCTTAPYAEPMTAAMINSLAILYQEGNRRHNWPNALANADGEKGFGFHRMAVNTACPCDVRLNMRQDILNQAFHVPVPLSKVKNMFLQDPTSGGYWVVKEDGAVLAYDGAPFLGGSNGAKFNNQNKPCIGIARFVDGHGEGYTTCHQWGPDDYRRYRFPRDGSGQ